MDTAHTGHFADAAFPAAVLACRLFFSEDFNQSAVVRPVATSNSSMAGISMATVVKP